MKHQEENKGKEIFNALHQCPNCWGYQEYNGKTIKRFFNKSLGWIQEYVHKYLNH